MSKTLEQDQKANKNNSPDKPTNNQADQAYSELENIMKSNAPPVYVRQGSNESTNEVSNPFIA